MNIAYNTPKAEIYISNEMKMRFIFTEKIFRYLLLLIITVVFGSKTYAQTPDEILQQAGELYGVEKFEEMATLLESKKTLFSKLEAGDNKSLYNIFLGVGYLKIGELDHVKPLFDSGFDGLEKTYGKISREYYSLYQWYITYHLLSNDSINLAHSCVEYLDIANKVLDKTETRPTVILNQIAEFYVNQENYHAAHKYYTWYKSLLDKDDSDYQQVMQKIIDIDKILGNITEFENHYWELIDIQCDTISADNKDCLLSLFKLGNIYWQEAKNLERSESCLLPVIEALQNDTTEDARIIKMCSFICLGQGYMHNGQYEISEKLLNNAYEIRKTIEFIFPPTASRMLGEFYIAKGEYAISEKYLLEAKEYYEKNYDNYQSLGDYISAICDLGIVYQYTGNNQLAEQYMIEAVKKGEIVFGATSPSYANCLNNLGLFYRGIGNNKLAYKYITESGQIIKSVLGENHPEFARMLGNLGVMLSEQEDFEEARNVLLQAKQIYENQEELNKPFYAMILNSLGSVECQEKNYNLGIEYLLKAKKIHEEVLGNSLERFLPLNNLSIAYFFQGNYIQSLKYMLDAKEFLKIYPDNPYWNTCLQNIALTYFLYKDYPNSLNALKEWDSYNRKTVSKNFSYMSEKQRNDFWYNTNDGIVMGHFANTILTDYTTSATQSLAYNNVLFSKGLLLRSTNEIRDAILNSGNQNLISQFEQLDAIRQQITALQAKTDKYEKDYIQSLEDRADSLDKALTVASVAYREQKADLNIEWKDIQNNLSDNEMAIEFIDYQKFNKEWTDTTMYAALIVRKDFENPIFVPLFEKSQLDLLLADENKDTGKRIANLYNGGSPRFYNGQKLYQLVWQPLEKYLSDIKSVYYSPSGVLNQISFAAIPVNTVLLMDKYNLHLVSSTREIVRMKTKETAFLPVHKAVEYGGIRYDVENSQDLIASTKKYKTEETPYWVSRSFSNDSTRSGWTYLQGTEEEVIEVEDILRKSNVPNIKLMGISANEESFKNLSGQSPELLHIATHGFFLADEKSIRETGFMQIINNQNNTYINPLLRSGLLFAGANRAWKNEDVILGIEDGILTAEEIAYLNLSKTNLVVLSACETGLGEVQNSEGVFGLQRAFKLAGVKTLVMALWKVDDVATSEFMIAFYQSLLSGKTKQEAFKIAQQQIREKYKSPYYWAGFVMMD
jgi:CHAT domain-containing protein